MMVKVSGVADRTKNRIKIHRKKWKRKCQTLRVDS